MGLVVEGDIILCGIWCLESTHRLPFFKRQTIMTFILFVSFPFSFFFCFSNLGNNSLNMNCMPDMCRLAKLAVRGGFVDECIFGTASRRLSNYCCKCLTIKKEFVCMSNNLLAMHGNNTTVIHLQHCRSFLSPECHWF